MTATIHFLCNHTQVQIDLMQNRSLFQELTFRDVIYTLISEHNRSPGNDLHRPWIELNGRLVFPENNEFAESAGEVLNDGDVIIFGCDNSVASFRSLMEAVHPPTVINEDVKVVISRDEFSRIGEDVTISLNESDEGSLCVICQDMVKNGDKVKILPAPCSHSFHYNCIQQWLTKESLLCPICKREVSSKKNFIGVDERETITAELPSSDESETLSIVVPNTLSDITEYGGRISHEDIQREEAWPHQFFDTWRLQLGVLSHHQHQLTMLERIMEQTHTPSIIL